MLSININQYNCTVVAEHNVCINKYDEGNSICIMQSLCGQCKRYVTMLYNNNNNNNNVLFTQGSHFSYETALPAGPA